jgi:hypothetical protein
VVEGIESFKHEITRIEKTEEGVDRALELIRKVDKILARPEIDSEEKKANVIQKALWEIIVIADRYRCLDTVYEILKDKNLSSDERWFGSRDVVFFLMVHFMNQNKLFQGTLFYLI